MRVFTQSPFEVFASSPPPDSKERDVVCFAIAIVLPEAAGSDRQATISKMLDAAIAAITDSQETWLSSAAHPSQATAAPQCRHNGRRNKTERDYASAAELAEITGLSTRYFLRLAAEKRVSWASQPGGPNTIWRFDVSGFEAWWKSGGTKKWAGFTKGGKSGGGGYRIRERISGGPLAQALRAKLRSV